MGRMESLAERGASVVLGGAVAFASYHWLDGMIAEPQIALFAAVAGAISGLICWQALNALAGRGRQFAVPIFDDVTELDEFELDELLLTERVDDELVLTDADRLNSPAPLELDDILGQIGPDSRVVRLFDRQGDADAGAAQDADRQSSPTGCAVARAARCVTGAFGRARRIAPLASLVVAYGQRFDRQARRPVGPAARFPARPMSATITPGMLNSASSSPSHMRSSDLCEFGPGMRSCSRWRSPVKVSERQSTDCASRKQNPIARHARPGRSAREAARKRPRTWRSGSLGRRLEIGEHALDRARPGVAAVAQDRTQTADLQRHLVRNGSGDVSLRRRNLSTSLSKFTCRCPYGRMRLGVSLPSNAIPTCLGIYLSLLRTH